MNLTFRYEAPSKAMIYNWFKEFSCSHKNFGDDIQEVSTKECCDSQTHWCCEKTNHFWSSCDIWWNRNIFEYLKEPGVTNFILSFPHNLSQVQKDAQAGVEIRSSQLGANGT